MIPTPRKYLRLVVYEHFMFQNIQVPWKQILCSLLTFVFNHILHLLFDANVVNLVPWEFRRFPISQKMCVESIHKIKFFEYFGFVL